MAILTDARQAVWDAIDNWPTLSGAFRQKLRYEPDVTGKLSNPESDEPTGMDFPAIGVFPSVVNPAWLGNQVQFRPYSLSVQIWTAGWKSLPQNEQLWQDVIDAIYKCKLPDNSDTYIGAATMHGPYGFGNSRWLKVTTKSGQRAISHTFDVVLRIITSLTV